MSDLIVAGTADPPSVEPTEIVVVASNPEQMQIAQASLISHFKGKLEQLGADLTEAQTNLNLAKSSKWKTKPFARIVTNLENEAAFYAKVIAALEAGYVIVPNFSELDVFAIRTIKRRPKRKIARGGDGWVNPPEAQTSESPMLGGGRYVDADTENEIRTDSRQLKDGSFVNTKVATASAFQRVDFPFRFAKPEILERTADAMQLLCFDDIGMLPNRNKRRGDPMIIGRISTKKRTVSFLITWFVDTRAI